MLKNLRRVDIVSVDYLYGVEYIGKLKTAETYIYNGTGYPCYYSF